MYIIYRAGANAFQGAWQQCCLFPPWLLSNLKETNLIRPSDVLHIYLWYDLLKRHDSCVIWLIEETWRMCDMTHWRDMPHVWYYSFLRLWHESFKRHDSHITHNVMWLIQETWLNHICGMTHSCMWHDSFVYVTWLIHVNDMTHSCMLHDSFLHVTWLIHVRHMTHSCMWHVSLLSFFRFDSYFCWTTSLSKTTWMTHVTYINESCHVRVMSHMSDVTYKGVVSDDITVKRDMNDLCHVHASHHQSLHLVGLFFVREVNIF